MSHVYYTAVPPFREAPWDYNPTVCEAPWDYNPTICEAPGEDTSPIYGSPLGRHPTQCSCGTPLDCLRSKTPLFKLLPFEVDNAIGITIQAFELEF